MNEKSMLYLNSLCFSSEQLVRKIFQMATKYKNSFGNYINVFSKCIAATEVKSEATPMVKVITIMDDVYGELYRLKKAKGMSFSEIMRFLVEQHQKQNSDILNLAGSLEKFDLDRRAMQKMKGEHNGKNLLG